MVRLALMAWLFQQSLPIGAHLWNHTTYTYGFEIPGSYGLIREALSTCGD